MKLRNKKTGKVFDVIVREKSNGDGEYSIIVCNLRALRSARSLSPILGEYDSLDKLNEEWEDYKPAEPLIKDPKIRKAVRAWTETNQSKFIKRNGNYTASDNRGLMIEFNKSWTAYMENGKQYTIDELCGEEK